MFKFAGIPIFKALSQHGREKSVSVIVAIDYAKSNSDDHLKERIDEYEERAKERLTNEVLATTNFILVGLVAWISHSTGAPNFLMQVASFGDTVTYSAAYEVCLVLLAVQGIVGRAINFNLLHASGNLPPEFFINEDERARAEAWAEKMTKKYEPLVRQWTKT